MDDTQRFGGTWTVQKLEAVERYLSAYTQALKNLPFKLCYIDAFSGSGNVTLKDGTVVEGSALRALKYPFNQYYFFEKNISHSIALREKINANFTEKCDIINIVNDDCNKHFQNIDTFGWNAQNWRGVIFLDPYAMQFPWSSLETISKTRVFDVWYLFPFLAVNRNLPVSGEISQANEDTVTKIFGSSDWKDCIYTKSLQQQLWGDDGWEKSSVDGIKEYILGRLRSVFCAVSPNAAILRNQNNSPLFLLCFAMNNPSAAAQKLSLKIADHLLK